MIEQVVDVCIVRVIEHPLLCLGLAVLGCPAAGPPKHAG